MTKKICQFCLKEREFSGNDSMCDGCRTITTWNRKNKKWKYHYIIFHSNNLLGNITHSHGGWAISYRKDGKTIILVDVKKIMKYDCFNAIPLIVNVISHEVMHDVLREHSRFTSTMMDRSKFLKMIKHYLGGTPTPTPDVMYADELYDKFIAEIKNKGS